MNLNRTFNSDSIIFEYLRKSLGFSLNRFCCSGVSGEALANAEQAWRLEIEKDRHTVEIPPIGTSELLSKAGCDPCRGSNPGVKLFHLGGYLGCYLNSATPNANHCNSFVLQVGCWVVVSAMLEDTFK